MKTSAIPRLVGGFLLCLVTHAVAEPPKPPVGFRWIPNPAFTDEFDGTKLDADKWHDHHPRWRGRAPAMFVPDTITLKDGMMQIRNRMLDQPDGPFTIAGGAVVSKSEEAFFGYYECRMKASAISMSSTFWMSNRGRQTEHGRVSLELDIQETVGGPTRLPRFALTMNSNTHVWLGGDSTAKGNHVEVSPSTSEAFHTYGAWWVDATTVHFYHNDKLVGTVHPDTRLSETPFDQPMHVNMVTETYDWETPPTPEEVNNPEINTTYYDWVRAYTLTPAGEPLSYAEFRKLQTTPREWKDDQGMTSELALLIKVEDDMVHLRTRDKSVLRIPVKALCAEDRHILHRISLMK